MGELALQTRINLSSKDEMVSLETARLFEKTSCVTVKHLTASGHYYYSPEDQQLLRKDFLDLIQEVSD